MYYWEVLAYDEGYQLRLRDMEAISAEQGYWAAYFSWNKHQKSLKDIITDIYNPVKHRKLSSAEMDDAIYQFQKRERARKSWGK
jgi:hypothetical protein